MIPFIEFDVPHWEDHSPRMDSTPHQPLHRRRQATPPSPPDGVHMGVEWGVGGETEGLKERAVCDTHDKRLSLCRR